VASFRKGDSVRFTQQVVQEASRSGAIDLPVVYITRLTTPEEVEAWRNSDDACGFDCAGETKLPPTAVQVPLPARTTMTVLRGRCAPHYSYRVNRGRALVRCNITGREGYVRRDRIEHIQE
jgi:hypothetical protein